eukprot:TRINITY_DN9666_c0_g1_i1.p1 TRINITY_DN9666_c0_g1~~TRINITY_DN9666_c0_g1_i1.p1  ORF type:complete len:446 (+),score=124.17 TRINITY_DN9666_c0_g1_i1:127-1338(+)
MRESFDLFRKELQGHHYDEAGAIVAKVSRTEPPQIGSTRIQTEIRAQIELCNEDLKSAATNTWRSVLHSKQKEVKINLRPIDVTFDVLPSLLQYFERAKSIENRMTELGKDLNDHILNMLFKDANNRLEHAIQDQLHTFRIVATEPEAKPNLLAIASATIESVTDVVAMLDSFLKSPERMNIVGRSIWHPIQSGIINCLNRCIPSKLADLKDLEGPLTKAESFNQLACRTGLIPSEETSLKKFRGELENLFVAKKQTIILEKARNLILSSDYALANAQQEEIWLDFELVENSRNLTGQTIHVCIKKLMDLTKSTLDEASATSWEGSGRLVETIRHIFDLFLAIHQFNPNLKRNPNADTFVNDCLYLIQQLRILPHRYKSRLGSVPSFVDVIPMLSDLVEQYSK